MSRAGFQYGPGGLWLGAKNDKTTRLQRVKSKLKTLKTCLPHMYKLLGRY